MNVRAGAFLLERRFQARWKKHEQVDATARFSHRMARSVTVGKDLPTDDLRRAM